MESLEAYRAQRDQVAGLIAADPSAEGVDGLRELFDSLTELINLTAGNDDLSSFAVEETTAEPEATNDIEESESTNCITRGWSAEEQELADSLLHMQCKVPFQHSWGQMVYSNAMIQSMESSPVSDDVEEVHVRVLFLQPTHRKMTTCKFFLDGRCRFSAKDCHFSHGEVYPLSSLKPYEPPDFSTVDVGTQVLCQNSEGVWERGIVAEFEKPNDTSDLASPQITVKISGKGEHVVTDLQNIVPKIWEERESDQADTSDASNDLDGEEAEFIPHSAWEQSGVQPVQQVGCGFGQWETHTTGVASKLMARMGFVVGTGLGSRSDGRIEPIIAQVYPKGRTLDYCMELREQKELPKVGEEARKVNMRKNTPSKRSRGPKHDVFSVINAQMALHRQTTTAHASSERNSTKIKNAKEQNVALIKLQDRINVLEKDLTRLRSSLVRNQTVDKTAANVITERINGKETELAALRRKHGVLLGEISKQKDKKTLCIF